MQRRQKNLTDFVTTGVLFEVSDGKYRLFKFTHGRDRNIAKAWKNMLLSAWRRKKRLVVQFAKQLDEGAFIDFAVADVYGFGRGADDGHKNES